MKTCPGVMTAECLAEPAQPYTGLAGEVWLCDRCYAVAQRMGMSLRPVEAARRRVLERTFPAKVYWA